MKNLIKTYACSIGAFSLCCGTANADEEMDLSLQSVGSEHMGNANELGGYPFNFAVRGDWIGRSKIDKKHLKKTHEEFCARKHPASRNLEFYTTEAQLDAVVYYNKQCQEGITLGLSYCHTRFDWKDNPYFNSKNLDQVSFTLDGFSQRLHNWFWVSTLTANWEPKYSGFLEYTNYDILLWGRYACDPEFNMHIGFLAYTGMKIDRIFPIIGFDWTISEKWKLNAVFPVNISAVYTINEYWDAAIAGRFFYIRYRFGNHSFDKDYDKALIQYQNLGAELAINYKRENYSFNLHGGVTLKGRFRVSNRHNKEKHPFDLDPAGYIGGEAVVKF